LVTTLATGAIVGGLGGFIAADLISEQLGYSGSNTKLTQKNYDKPKYGGPKEVAAAKEELRAIFAKQNGEGKDKQGPEPVSDDPSTLETYGFSHNSYHPAHLHSMVVHVRTTEEVVKVVNVARKYRIPVTAYSGGTSLEGNFSGVSSISIIYAYFW
jgi:D-lactate dehydrogenase (cytochrome)